VGGLSELRKRRRRLARLIIIIITWRDVRASFVNLPQPDDPKQLGGYTR